MNNNSFNQTAPVVRAPTQPNNQMKLSCLSKRVFQALDYAHSFAPDFYNDIKQVVDNLLTNQKHLSVSFIGFPTDLQQKLNRAVLNHIVSDWVNKRKPNDGQNNTAVDTVVIESKSTPETKK